MTQDELNKLNPGDIVRGKSSKELYVVTGNYGGRVTAVKTADITNPIEWEVINKVAGDEIKTCKRIPIYKLKPLLRSGG